MEPAVSRIMQNRKRKRKNCDNLEYLKIALLNCRKLRLEQQLEVIAPKIKATCESGFTFYYSVKNSDEQSPNIIQEKPKPPVFTSNTNIGQNHEDYSQSVSENSSNEDQEPWDPLEPFKALDSFTESAKNITTESDDSDIVQAYQLLQELMVSATAAESLLSQNKITNDSTSTICSETLLMLKLASTSLHPPEQMFDQRLVL